MNNRKSGLYGLSLQDMSNLITVKKLAQKEKGKDFNCFAIDSRNLFDFFNKLKSTIHKLADPTRFQLIVSFQFAEVPHWFVIDCYIKDRNLQTFVLDASVEIAALMSTLNTLHQTFPNGAHFVFLKPKNDDFGMQATYVDCQTFAREHATKLFNMNPEELYPVLHKHTHKSKIAPSVNEFSRDDLNAEMTILATLFRSMQSLKRIDSLPQEFKQSVVSSKKNKDGNHITFQDWVDNFTDDKKQNNSILYKENQYCKKLASLPNNSAGNLDSGFGFISLPLLSRLSSIFENRSMQDFKEHVISKTIEALDLAPKYTSVFSVFKFKADHYDQTEKTKTKLEEIYNSDGDDSKKIIQQFKEIINDYFCYLKNNHSQRTLPHIEKFFDQLDDEINKLDKEIKVDKKLGVDM